VHTPQRRVPCRTHDISAQLLPRARAALRGVAHGPRPGPSRDRPRPRRHRDCKVLWPTACAHPAAPRGRARRRARPGARARAWRGRRGGLGWRPPRCCRAGALRPRAAPHPLDFALRTAAPRPPPPRPLPRPASLWQPAARRQRPPPAAAPRAPLSPRPRPPSRRLPPVLTSPPTRARAAERRPGLGVHDERRTGRGPRADAALAAPRPGLRPKRPAVAVAAAQRAAA
jgi:hypothetical protein